ncbi:MAG: TetR/AcrR family transcriptional regulator [Sphingobacteriales bacterium]|nr:TetR/AcrR family transcriptional regulator [Sphingobacteriales bacterium]MBI3720359.1 TetR/AcrR family transcriptional regulator [Sphingobacteriales bacterium]
MNYSDKQIQIMEAAEELFAEQGFNGTSVRDIAEKAQINLAMISYYFGSKDKLLETLFEYRGEISKQKLVSIIEKPNTTSLEKVNLLIDNYIEKVFNQQCFYKIFAREQVLTQTGHIAELILQMKKNNQENISHLIQEGQKKGEFKKNIDTALMMHTIVGTANHLITTKHHYRELNNLQSLSEEELLKLIRKKIATHLKFIIKAILTHEV